MKALFEHVGSFKNILFVYSDPGGAKPILSFVALFRKTYPKLSITVISDRKYSFSKEFSDVEIVTNIEDWLRQNNGFDFVFTGTSYTSNIEVLSLKWAIQRKLTTLSFVDHWSSMKNRFNYQDQFYLPSTVLVIDAKAKSNAIQDEIEENRVEIIENPYHQYLSTWQPQLSRNDFLAELELDQEKFQVVTFAPDPVSNLDWLSKYGEDESTILNTILSSLLELKMTNIQILVQPHPNQDIALLRAVIDRKEFKILKIKVLFEVDVPTLLWHSDIVIGLFSNILLEAVIFNTPVIRYIPSSIPDYMEKSIGTKITDKATFKDYILNFMLHLD